MAVACEPPGDSGRPLSQWTPRELAEEAVQRGIVPSISARTVRTVGLAAIFVDDPPSTFDNPAMPAASTILPTALVHRTPLPCSTIVDTKPDRLMNPRYPSPILLMVVAAVFLWAGPPAQADSVVVFNEIMYHPAVNEPGLEWVELHNENSVDVDLSGWRLT